MSLSMSMIHSQTSADSALLFHAISCKAPLKAADHFYSSQLMVLRSILCPIARLITPVAQEIFLVKNVALSISDCAKKRDFLGIALSIVAIFTYTIKNLLFLAPVNILSAALGVVTLLPSALILLCNKSLPTRIRNACHENSELTSQFLQRIENIDKFSQTDHMEEETFSVDALFQDMKTTFLASLENEKRSFFMNTQPICNVTTTVDENKNSFITLANDYLRDKTDNLAERKTLLKIISLDTLAEVGFMSCPL